MDCKQYKLFSWQMFLSNDWGSCCVDAAKSVQVLRFLLCIEVLWKCSFNCNQQYVSGYKQSINIDVYLCGRDLYVLHNSYRQRAGLLRMLECRVQK